VKMAVKYSSVSAYTAHTPRCESSAPSPAKLAPGAAMRAGTMRQSSHPHSADSPAPAHSGACQPAAKPSQAPSGSPAT
jgi:hypothetical protein